MTKTRITGLVASIVALVLSVLTLSGDPASATVICPSSGATMTYVLPPVQVAGGGVIGRVVCVIGNSPVPRGAQPLGVNANVTRLCVVAVVLSFPVRTLACSYSYPLHFTPLVPFSAYRLPGRGSQLIATQAFHDGTYTLSDRVHPYP